MQCVIWQEGSRSRALGMMCRMMASWMQGSVRECFLNMLQNTPWCKDTVNKQVERQALSTRIMNRTWSSWTQRSMRGCFARIRQNCELDSETKKRDERSEDVLVESESLIEELQRASIAYREESMAASAEQQARLNRIQVHSDPQGCINRIQVHSNPQGCITG